MNRDKCGNQRPVWNSHLGFILASLGSAAGLGNIWRFPYIAGKHGGGAFILVCLVMSLCLCVIPLCNELFTGKKYSRDVVGVFETISPKLKFFGYLNFFTAFLVGGFYVTIGGWIVHYFLITLINAFPVNHSEYFGNFTSNPVQALSGMIVFLLISAYACFKGVNSGIEKANKIMLPLLVVMLLFLAGASLTLPGAKDGLLYMFKPDFTKITPEVLKFAFGQSLFSLGVGIGGMMTYGSYADKEPGIFRSAYTIIAGDTLIAICAGIMIFPAVFTFNVSPEAGPGLVFVTLPGIFSRLPFGEFFAFLFFTLLLFASITSFISIIETSVAVIKENFRLSRQKASVFATLGTLVIAVPATLSFGVWNNFKIFNKTFFENLDYLTSNVFLPFNVLILCLIVGFIVKPKFEELSISHDKAGTLVNKAFSVLLKYVVPVCIFVILVNGI